jgi:DNA-binding MarR family transcriptional regulator
MKRAGSVLRVRLWVGFSRFQVPAVVKSLLTDSTCSKSTALVYAVLYSLGGKVASRSYTEKEVVVSAKLKTLASITGLSVDTIKRCMKELSKRNLIEKWKHRDRTKLGKMGSNRYALLHPLTGEHLRVNFSKGMKQGLCFSNGIDLYVAMPHYPFRKAGVVSRMTVPQQNGYLSAMVLGSEFKSMRFPVVKLEWRQVANLSRKSFGPAVEYLEEQGLLHYDGKTLTLYDPETREESIRWAEERGQRVRVKGSKSGFDYDAVTAEQWQTVLREVLHREFEIGGWSRRSPCPFKHHSRDCFSVNLEQGCFNCFGCKVKGKLSKLVRLTNGTDNTQTRLFIASLCGVTLEEWKEELVKLPEEETADTRTAVLAGSIEDI